MLREEFENKLKKYLPESESVQLVFKEMHPEYKDSIVSQGFNETIFDLTDSALNGDQVGLLHLLELVWEGAHNEGLLEGMLVESD